MNKSIAKKKAHKEIQEFFIAQVDTVLKGHPVKPDEYQSAEQIVHYWSRLNAALAGGGAFIPGPVGMVAAIPTLLAEIRNQICMLKEIAAFYHKDKLLDKNLVLLLLFYSAGGGAGKYLIIRAGSVLVKRESAKIMQRIAERLAIKTTQRLTAKFAGVYVPIIGSAAMAVWSYTTCHSIGKQALRLLSKELIINSAAY